MSKLARLAQAALILTTTTTPALAAGLPGFTLAAQTPRFSFYTRGGKVDAQKSERYLSQVEQKLGARFDGHAEYFRYDSVGDVAVSTGSYAEGVTFTGQRQIHSMHDFHAHEIVHLVAGQLGNPGVLFHEGLAVVMGNDAKWGGKDVDKISKQALKGRRAVNVLAQFETLSSDVAYPLAGSFVRSLVAQHGMEKVADFFRACPRPAERDAAFEKTFGVSYAQAVDQWAARL
jgi:hypothetical protein